MSQKSVARVVGSVLEAPSGGCGCGCPPPKKSHHSKKSRSCKSHKSH